MRRMTTDEFCAKADKLNRLQTIGWRKHFEKHPEQRLPGAEVRMAVPLNELGLLADLIGDGVFVSHQS